MLFLRPNPKLIAGFGAEVALDLILLRDSLAFKEVALCHLLLGCTAGAVVCQQQLSGCFGTNKVDANAALDFLEGYTSPLPPRPLVAV